MARTYHKSKRTPPKEPTTPRKLPPLKPKKPRPVYVRKPPADDHDATITAIDVECIVDEVSRFLAPCPTLLARAPTYLSERLANSRSYWNERRNYTVLQFAFEVCDIVDPPSDERRYLDKIKEKLLSADQLMYQAFHKVIRKHLREQP